MQSDNTASNAPKTSFFDDDDLSQGFPFQKNIIDTSVAPIFTTKLYLKISPNDFLQQGVFALYDKTFVHFKNSTNETPEGSLSLSNSKVKLLVSTLEIAGFGFSITKNGVSYEFYSNEEQVISEWMAALKQFCIMTNFHEEYKAIKMIGKGSFAKVYLVESKTTGKNFAVKAFTKESLIISNNVNAKPSMINEIEIMRALNHENVIKLYEVYETERSIYLVLELIQGKSLQDTLKKSGFKDNENRIINIISSILDVLAYLASKGIMHRDVKPDNILLDKGDKVKLVDFGLSTFIDVPEYIFKKCGTPGYIAPEVFKFDAKDPTKKYDSRCDVFSAGCILFYMIFGFLFFDGPNATEILKVNKKFTPEFQTLQAIKDELRSPTSKISKEALDLLVKLLEFEPNDRITAAEALNHPYLFSVMQQKLAGLYDVYQNGGYSPNLYDRRNSIAQEQMLQQQIKTGSINSPNRYVEKDSLYLDMGKPEINGKVDTITNGSANNSLLFMRESNTPGTPNSTSTFKTSGVNSASKQSSTFKTQTSRDNNFLKAAIFRNMQNNHAEEAKDDGVMKPKPVEFKTERRYSDFGTSKMNPFLTASNKNPSHESEDDLKEHPQLITQAGKGKRTSNPTEAPVRRSSEFSHSQYMYEKGA